MSFMGLDNFIGSKVSSASMANYLWVLLKCAFVDVLRMALALEEQFFDADINAKKHDGYPCDDSRP